MAQSSPTLAAHRATIVLAHADPAPRQSTALILEAAGYQVRRCTTGQEAIDLVYALRPNLVIVDLPIPPLDSLGVCQRVREDRATLHVNRIPILVVGAGDDDVDEVVALEIGADDYLPRTTGARLLLAHVKALLRRAELAPSPVSGEDTRLISGDLSIDLVTREVRRAGTMIAMTPREFDLLAYFVAHARQVISRDQLLTHVWGYGAERDTNSLGVHLSWIRTKIESDPSRPIRLRTLRGRGYVFTG